MAMTRAQWDALQRRLPPEDRESYENYLKSEGLTTAPATPLAAAEGGLIAAQSMQTQTTGGPAAPLTTPSAVRGGTVLPSGRPTIMTDATGERPGRAWLFENGQWVKPEPPVDNNSTIVLSSRKMSNGQISQTLQTISYEWNDSRGWQKKTTTSTKRFTPEQADVNNAESDATKAAVDAAKTEAEANAAVAGTAGKTVGTETDVSTGTTVTTGEDVPADNNKPGTGKTVLFVSYTGSGKNRIKITRYSDNTEDREPAPEDESPTPKTVVSTKYEGTGKNRVKVITYSDNTLERIPEPEEEPPSDKKVVSVTYEGTGKNRIKVTKYSDNTETREAAPEEETPGGDKPGGDVKIVDSQYLGTGANRILRTYYSNGTYTDVAAPEVTGTGVAGQDAATLELLKQLQKQNADIMAQMAAQQQQAQADAKAAAEAVAKEKRESAIKILTDRFTKYGLASLVPRIEALARQGASESTITLELQESDEYQERFKANKDRIKKGLSVLDPGEYLGLEDSYRQILRAYGLRQFDTDAYVSQFISNDVSTAELSSRVQLAVQRVQNADPAVLNTLNKFYGIATNDLVAYALDPETQFQKIERQVAAAEIGVAAGLQGFVVDKGFAATAEQLAAQGITQAEARKGYATIADILPTATKLSQIYSGVLEGYGLAEAEQEVFNTLASAQRKRRSLVEREAASFSGQSGVGRTSLTQQTGGTI